MKLVASTKWMMARRRGLEQDSQVAGGCARPLLIDEIGGISLWINSGVGIRRQFDWRATTEFPVVLYSRCAGFRKSGLEGADWIDNAILSTKFSTSIYPFFWRDYLSADTLRSGFGTGPYFRVFPMKSTIALAYS